MHTQSFRVLTVLMNWLATFGNTYFFRLISSHKTIYFIRSHITDLYLMFVRALARSSFFVTDSFSFILSHFQFPFAFVCLNAIKPELSKKWKKKSSRYTHRYVNFYWNILNYIRVHEKGNPNTKWNELILIVYIFIYFHFACLVSFHFIL